MPVKIANWTSSGITAQISGDEVAFFIPGETFRVRHVGEYLFYAPSKRKDAAQVIRCTASRNAGYGYRHTGRISLNMPSFMISEIDYDLRGDALVWKIPPIHELPWTKTKPSAASNGDDAVGDAVRCGLRARLASAKKYNVDFRRVFEQLPNWARGVIPGSEIKSIVEDEK